MRNITVFSNWLDESTGIVEHVLEMKTTKTPWHLRFAHKAKGLVSFVQNLLFPLTQKEGVRGGQLSAFFQSAAAAVVGIALLVGSNAAVQAACYPPIYDPCFHKSNWTSAGYATLYVEFDLPSGKVGSGQLYEVQWNGLKKLRNDRGVFELTGKRVSDEGLSGYDKISFSYRSFWWVPLSMWQNYGCTIYEGHWDYNNQDENGRPTWVRGTQVASLDFYPYQDAALVYLDTSAAPFEFSQYYHTIDYDTDLPPGYLRHGYSEGYWTYWPWQRPNWNGWVYFGDPGSPRFHYRQLCSVIIPPPPRTPSNTRSR